jgi:hypothetical protein
MAYLTNDIDVVELIAGILADCAYDPVDDVLGHSAMLVTLALTAHGHLFWRGCCPPPCARSPNVKTESTTIESIVVEQP